ncbi:AraC family transcriptional regulator [Parablautia intestinalis]|jgi:AraC-like DNA-binding protein|uniref:AraC family transcriptional regulator n=1 Tax=Parablautia intestinalis TaxID=2320100 RepID=A0A3A9AKW6_9FIRM|nr:AraC family transcriptional regulator [Parablautia intestinalis]MCI8615153.1 AraC family transcriptional regulator [Lachnospiraceae bacterium]MDE7046704.1 AraC family transcriptional regulator [Lachnospiraceae bacterium]RKI92037.1 AraC family transcriptional regulator [Parablautia intestinalis]
MQHFFEYIDTLNSTYEAFLCDASKINFPIRPHWHYFMEMLYMLEGAGRVECNGENYVVEAGDMIIFYPESVHAIYTIADRPLKYGVIKFDVNKLYTENSYAPKLRIILESAAKSREAGIFFKEDQLKGLEVKEIFEECRRELKRRNYGYDVIVHNQICFLLVHLIRLWRENGFDTDAAVSYPPDTNSIRGITAYIDEHADEQIKVEDLADICNMSYSCFAKNFKQYYGRSCKEYIEFIRISKASDLLLFTDFDLNYISQETGFSDSSHLIKIFKKWKGVTPKQFKKNNK